MGSCASIGKQRKISRISDKFPVCVIDWKRNSIIKLEPSWEISKISVSEILQTDCAYKYEYPSTVYLIGGCDSENNLHNDSIKVNLDRMSLEYLPSLPINSKYGDLHCYGSALYYTGGVRLHSAGSYPTPFLRLLKDSSCWEILEERSRAGKKLMITNELYRPGSCIVNKSLYIIGGEVMIPNYSKTYNENVYELNLDSLSITILPIRGVISVGPRCILHNQAVLVLGLSQDSISFMKVLGDHPDTYKELPFKFKPSIFLQKINNFVVVLTNKKLKKLRDDKNLWKIEQISPNKVKDNGCITNVINSKPKSELPINKVLKSE
jgi:hypothetical protein